MLAWLGNLWSHLFPTVQWGTPPLDPAPGSPPPWQPAYPVYSGVVNRTTMEVSSEPAAMNAHESAEVGILLHPRVVAPGQKTDIRAIFANVPTGFVEVSFRCSGGHFVDSNGEECTEIVTGATGYTLRGYTFWREAEATWIAPDLPAEVTVAATLRAPDGEQWHVSSKVVVRDSLPLRIQCEVEPPVWVAYLSSERRLRIQVRLCSQEGLPAKHKKVRLTTDRGMLVVERQTAIQQEVIHWEPTGEVNELVEYTAVARSETTWRRQEVRSTAVETETNDQGAVSVYLEPDSQYGVAHVSVDVDGIVEVAPIVLLSPAGLRMMFSGSDLALSEQPETIKVLLLDEFGNPVAGEPVSFRSSIGYVEPDQHTTNDSGECTVRLYSGGMDGNAVVTATARGHVAKHYTRVRASIPFADQQRVPLSLPTIRLDVYVPASVRPAGAGFPDSETRGAVFVVADNSPTTPLSIYVTVQPLPRSGGHNHHSNRPSGTCTPWQGILIGAWTTTYVASDISGEEQVRIIPSAAFPFNPQPVNPSGIIRVQVPGLQNLPAGEGYALVGATSTHPSNHWAAPDVVTRLQSIASDFRREYASQPGYRTLNYNDISLEWGGLFDIRADWRPPHHEHRRGREVDFSNADALPLPLQEGLRRIILRHGGRSILHEEDHWHVRF